MATKLTISVLFFIFFGKLKCTEEFKINHPLREIELECDQDGFEHFNGNCYKIMGYKNFADSQKDCEDIGANLASIHNALTNQFLLELIQPSDLLIGLKYDEAVKNYTWTDHSPLNFTNWPPNFNATDTAHIFGECVLLQGSGQIVDNGQWFSKPCSDNDIPYICQKPAQEGPTDEPPTLAPLKGCPDSTWYMNGGMLYSPGYPYDYDSITNGPFNCSFLLGASPAPISITFHELSSYKTPETETETSTICIYDGSTEQASNLLANLTGPYILPKIVSSTKPTMFMRFTSKIKGKWRAEWGSSSSPATQEQSSVSFGSVPQGLK